jgi:hypothetical protein
MGNWPMLTPMSAIKLQAATRSIPGTVPQRESRHEAWFLITNLFQPLIGDCDLPDHKPPLY